MFKEKFIKMCNTAGESPSSVCRAVGIAPATFSNWTDESVPRRATLMRIADYFGVSVDYFLTEDRDKSEKVDEAVSELISLAKQLTEEQAKEVTEYARYIKAKK